MDKSITSILNRIKLGFIDKLRVAKTSFDFTKGFRSVFSSFTEISAPYTHSSLNSKKIKSFRFKTNLLRSKSSMATESSSLWKDILQKHDEALSAGNLIYHKAETQEVCFGPEDKIKYQLRLVPALSKKTPKTIEAKTSDSPKDYRSSPKFNPFLPCDPVLLVSNSALPDHNIILNKFCVIPGHILLTTKTFQSQTEPLSLSDFDALCTVMKQSSPVKTLGFFNCGELSGASQPHKHLQIIPVSEDEPPILDFLVNSLKNKPINQSLEIENLPYLHRVSHIFDPQDPIVIYQLYVKMLSEIGCEFSLHHNLIFFSGILYLLPRSKEQFEVDGEIFSINSLGAVHMILARSLEQKSCLLNLFERNSKDIINNSPQAINSKWVGQWVGWPKKPSL